MKALAIIALIQGIYYFLTGLWALLDINSFMEVTGPKTDIWLVKMVSVLILVISIVLIYSGLRKSVTVEIILLATASALGFIIIDVYYATIDRISDIYLLDAIAEAILLIAWGIIYFKKRNHGKFLE